jgi:8-oxo-dGTP pyrophosphatase MutT (NUDIX family)
LPGGGIEKGETPLNCIKREIFEEISIKCKNYKFIGQIINNGSYHFGEDCVYLATADIENMLIVANKKEYILGYEIFEWERFMKKEYKNIRISGVLSALMLAYINIKKSSLI